MAEPDLQWRTNLRGNLLLWPDLSPNVATLLKQDGKQYDEAVFLGEIPIGDGEKVPTDTRAVRNTAEVLALSGLAFRDSRDVYRLTNLGATAVQFLRAGENGQRPASERNIHLLGECFLNGLICVAEYRAILLLMLKCEGRLSNEELNRALARLKNLTDVEVTADAIIASRRSGDPTSIGPRIYDDASYENGDSRSEQRRAMNPIFLLTGAGGLIINVTQDKSGFRTLSPWASELILNSIESAATFSSHNPLITRLIAHHSRAPFPHY